MRFYLLPRESVEVGRGWSVGDLRLFGQMHGLFTAVDLKQFLRQTP